MPDASMDATLDALIAASFGMAGERCMTLSTAVFVGGSMPWYSLLLGFIYLHASSTLSLSSLSYPVHPYSICYLSQFLFLQLY